MAVMTLEVLRDGATEPLRFSVQLAGDDVDRISIAYAALLFPDGILVTPATETEAAIYRLPTGPEVLAAAAMTMVQQMSEKAYAWHRKKAIRDAEAAVAPLHIEPVV